MVSFFPLEGAAFRGCESGVGGLDFQSLKKRVKSNLKMYRVAGVCAVRELIVARDW